MEGHQVIPALEYRSGPRYMIMIVRMEIIALRPTFATPNIAPPKKIKGAERTSLGKTCIVNGLQVEGGWVMGSKQP
jgi:hypothetical protein